jgi:hypothetical protein
VRLIVPPITPSPTLFSTGNDSPVSIDSSTALAPETISPSVGTRSPGRTSTVSPGCTASTGISTSTPPLSTRATSGCSATSARSAADVCRFARASSVLPTSTSAMMKRTAS